MFNSPLQYCPVCTQYVAIDQTQRECAQDHRCKESHCPLAHLFAGAQTQGAVADTLANAPEAPARSSR